jgi:hypothetical protein
MTNKRGFKKASFRIKSNLEKSDLENFSANLYTDTLILGWLIQIFQFFGDYKFGD